MLTIITIFLLIAAFTFSMPKNIRHLKPFLYSAVHLIVFLWLLMQIPVVTDDGSIYNHLSWIPGLGINFDFQLDGLSLIFGLLVSGIGTLIFLFASDYMKKYDGKEQFYSYLFLFSGAMLGLVFAENLILMFIFWELTTVLSFMLISFFHEKSASRKAAFQSLFITGFGGLSMLGGIILLGTVVDSYSINEWIERGSEIRESRLYLPGLIMILLGALTKSAQFPFHFWLPGAMQAPGPVSAFLHSATMVKAGFYLLARINPVLGGTEEWIYIVSLAGVITMLLGSYRAITQKDIKAILAFTTINALGVLVLLMGIDTSLSIKAALLFMFVHAFYKAALFMIAGMIEKKTGTRNISLLGGLRKQMPVTFWITVFLALSMAGLPPMLGFLGKELIYEAKIQLPGVAPIVLVLGVISNIFMVTVSALFVYKIFLGRKGDTPKTPNEKSPLLLAGPLVLAMASLFFGLYPGLLGKTVIESAMTSILIETYQVKLKLWHGFNNVFFLSLFTIVAGASLSILLIRRKQILDAWGRFNEKMFVVDASEVFENIISGFVRFSDKKTAVMQHGYHRIYILTIFAFATIVIWFQLIYTWGWDPIVSLNLQPFYITAVVAIIIAATIYSAISRSRIATIVALGVIGYGISLIYLHYSAIDLAITQILVETLIVIMFVIVLQKLPKFARLSSRKTKLRDLTVALMFGSVMTVVAIKAVNVDFNYPISNYFLEKSYIEAFGRNVVNVILVDFRALDTMGEVIVLSIAAIGAAMLFTIKKRNA
ncbi:MAG TPA: hydrogen gas-evolving membrane-bound hydrogenase subunit E [Bacteroidales bacterium]|nr:hydrogen gas-evolving membrane-bound hydrogenase subunit E [Bacteroidales bacterium]